MIKIKFPIIFFGFYLILCNFLGVNADTEHVHIRLKIPKLINRHTHHETKYIHIFHPTPIKAHGFHHRKDGHAPQPYNSTSMEIKKPTLKNFEPSTTIMQQHHKMNSKEIFNHRFKNLRNMKAEDDDYDFPTALPSHGTAPNAQNLKFFVLDPPENRHDPTVIISPSANIMGARASPYTAAQSGELRNGYGSKLLSSAERTAPPQRLNRIPPPIPAVKNYAFNNDSFEELGKTKYWTSSGKKLGKKKPYHGPKKADRAESKRIKMTIRPKNEITVKVTKMPFIIKA